MGVYGERTECTFAVAYAAIIRVVHARCTLPLYKTVVRAAAGIRCRRGHKKKLPTRVAAAIQDGSFYFRHRAAQLELEPKPEIQHIAHENIQNNRNRQPQADLCDRTKESEPAFDEKSVP